MLKPYIISIEDLDLDNNPCVTSNICRSNGVSIDLITNLKSLESHYKVHCKHKHSTILTFALDNAIHHFNTLQYEAVRKMNRDGLFYV